MNPLNAVRVRNMVGPSGREVPNQFVITTDKGSYFQSYDSVIAFWPFNGAGKIQLDKEKWDYSKTTGKYRNIFLKESVAETRKKIENGTYELVNLN